MALPFVVAGASLACSNRKVQPWYVHVYVPVSAEVAAGFLFSELSGAYSLLLDSIDVRVAGKSSLTLERIG